MIAYGVSFLAGAMSTFSPCVFPIVPIVVGRAVDGRKLKPLIFVMGTIFTFVGFGLILGSATSILGLDAEQIRKVSTVLLVMAGITLVSEKLQERLSMIFPSIRNKLTSVSQMVPNNYWGDFLLGSLMGLVWGPCTGPLMGTALASAASGDLYTASTTMLFYGVGFGIPILAVSYLMGNLLRNKLNGHLGFVVASKRALGFLLIIFGLLSIFGQMTSLEAWMLNFYPTWLLELVSK